MSLSKNNRSYWVKFYRYANLKLIIPIKRSKFPPEYSAKGVAVGLFWGLTPTVGIQMPLCLLTWFALKRFRHSNFSLVLAFAWTWVSNFFTAIPMYYIFFVTGQIFVGQWDNLLGYDKFSTSFKTSHSKDTSAWTNFFEIGTFIFEELGMSMAIGCIPYALVGAISGYIISLRFITSRRAKRKNRL